MKRFVKEYGNFRISEIDEMVKICKFPKTIENLNHAKHEIKQLLKAYEKGLITTNETIRGIANIYY